MSLIFLHQPLDYKPHEILTENDESYDYYKLMFRYPPLLPSIFKEQSNEL